MASDTGDKNGGTLPPKPGKPGEPGYPQYEHGADNNAAPRKSLYDINQDSLNPGKTTVTGGGNPLQSGQTDQGGNGSQDRRPGAAKRNMRSRASAAPIYDSSVLYEDDRPR